MPSCVVVCLHSFIGLIRILLHLSFLLYTRTLQWFTKLWPTLIILLISLAFLLLILNKVSCPFSSQSPKIFTNPELPDNLLIPRVEETDLWKMKALLGCRSQPPWMERTLKIILHTSNLLSIDGGLYWYCWCRSWELGLVDGQFGVLVGIWSIFYDTKHRVMHLYKGGEKWLTFPSKSCSYLLRKPKKKNIQIRCLVYWEKWGWKSSLPCFGSNKARLRQDPKGNLMQQTCL